MCNLGLRHETIEKQKNNIKQTKAKKVTNKLLPSWIPGLVFLKPETALQTLILLLGI